MATDLCEGVFNQILPRKRLKIAKSSNACQSFRINPKALKLLERFFVLCTFQKRILYLGGLTRF